MDGSSAVRVSTLKVRNSQREIFQKIFINCPAITFPDHHRQSFIPLLKLLLLKYKLLYISFSIFPSPLIQLFKLIFIIKLVHWIIKFFLKLSFIIRQLGIIIIFRTKVSKTAGRSAGRGGLQPGHQDT